MVFSCDCRRLHNVTEPHPFAFALTPRTRLRCALRALFKSICIKNKYEHTRTGNRRELMIDRMFACPTGHSAARTSAHMHIAGVQAARGRPNNYCPWYLPPSSNFLEGLSLRTPLKLVSLLDDGTCVGRSGISLSSSAAAAALASSAVSVANTIGAFRSTHPVSDCE